MLVTKEEKIQMLLNSMKTNNWFIEGFSICFSYGELFRCWWMRKKTNTFKTKQCNIDYSSIFVLMAEVRGEILHQISFIISYDWETLN